MKIIFVIMLVAVKAADCHDHRKPQHYPTECKFTRGGQEYGGDLSVTTSGLPCQTWSSSFPHKHDYVDSTNYPEGSARGAGNKCRSPEGTADGVWCYTMDPNVRWQYCDVDFCMAERQTPGTEEQYPTECKFTRGGQEYGGDLSVTPSGLPCQPWASSYPHSHNYDDSTNYPEGSARGAGNKCRNPDNAADGVWCYTMDPNVRWQYCDVDFCMAERQTPGTEEQYPTVAERQTPGTEEQYPTECKFTRGGQEYGGDLSVTTSGLPCQPWSRSYPQSHDYVDSTNFPEGSARGAGNKCRNPEVTVDGVWCYTMDPNVRWQYCDVQFCEEATGGDQA